jgi:hypothetical protein
MIKNILTVGDSFTYGDELANQYDAWPYLLGALANADVVNLGTPAASNDKIVRTVIESTFTESADLIVIAWTSPGRTEYADENGYYDIWPGYSGNLFGTNTWRHDLVRYVTEHHNDSALHKKFIQQVLLVQSWLTSQNKRYLMLNTVQNEHYKKVDFDHREQYYTLIDQTHFMGFNLSGMAEWTYESAKGPNGHFLNDGHRTVAEKIYEYIRHLGWVS